MSCPRLVGLLQVVHMYVQSPSKTTCGQSLIIIGQTTSEISILAQQMVRPPLRRRRWRRLLETKSQSNSIWSTGGIRAFPEDKEWTQGQHGKMFAGEWSHHLRDIVNKLRNFSQSLPKDPYNRQSP